MIEIPTERLVLQRGTRRDAGAMLAFYERNRAHLERWEPARPEGFYTLDFWRRRLGKLDQQAFREGRELRWLLRDRETQELIGMCRVSNIVHGAFHAATLGYALDQAHQGQGLMREAVDAVVEHGFESLGLHRVMANYLPANERSAQLLRRCGFQIEGYARAYLKIAGRWQDHVLTAKVAESL